MHAQLTGSLALVAFVLLKHIHDETFFEFADSFRIENSAGVHLRNKCFKLVLHRVLTFPSWSSFDFVCAAWRTRYLVAAAWRSRATPSRNLCLTADGATQLAPCPATKKYPANCDLAICGESGANAVNAMTPTVTITTPRTNPKAPPRNRSAQRSPTPLIALRTIRAVMPASRMTAKKIVKNPARSAIASDFT